MNITFVTENIVIENAKFVRLKYFQWKFIFNYHYSINISLFKMTLGNPFHDHPKYLAELKKSFAEKGYSDEVELFWEKQPGFFLFYNYTNDYRVIRAYNIRHLIGTKKSGGFNDANNTDFFLSMAKSLLQTRKAAIIANKKVKENAGKILDIFKEEAQKNLKGTKEIAYLSDFLKEEENLTIDSFITSAGMTWIARASHAVSIAACFTGILSAINPVAGFTIALALDALCYYSNKSKLDMERSLNCAIVLNKFFNCINFYEEQVLNSNVFVTAIDERNFYSIMRSTSLRPNHGAWCDFLYIDDLPHSPRAKTIEDGRIIPMYIDIFREINTNDQLDLKKLENYLEGLNFLVRQVVNINENNKNDQNNQNNKA